jgi:CelD/BcsL family acetyltransferase involved in cellulose biosynthesis
LVRIEGGWRHLRQRVLAPVGLIEFDYHDPLSSQELPESLLAQFWQAFEAGLQESWYGRDVDRVTVPRLRERWSCPIGGARPTAGAPYADLADIRHLDALLARLGRHYRKSVRRELRRARQDYTVRLEVLAPGDVGHSRELLTRFHDLRRRRWPDALEPLEFFDNLVRNGCPSGVVHFSTLQFDEDVVSFHLGFYFGHVFYYYIPVYEPGAARYSPGLIHLVYLLEWCIERSCTRFDFLVGMEPYKQRWASGVDEVSAYAHDNPRLLSRCKNQGRRMLQRLKSSLRPG